MKLIISYWCYFSLFWILDFLDGISYTFSVKNGPFQASWIRIRIQEDKQTQIWIYSLLYTAANTFSRIICSSHPHVYKLDFQLYKKKSFYFYFLVSQ